MPWRFLGEQAAQPEPEGSEGGKSKMANLVIATCRRCGKEINLRSVITYRVLQDYRIVCKECTRVVEPPLIDSERKRNTTTDSNKKEGPQS